MTLTRRNLLKNGVIAGGAVAVPVAAKTMAPPAVVVFDSRDVRSRTFAALAGCSVLDVAQEDEKFWNGVRSVEPKGRVEGLTSWSDWVLVRGLLEERGLRVKQQEQTGNLFRWTMA